MGSVYEEITRLETAKADIETAIEGCGVNVPDTDLISTYALYIRQIPSAVFSELNVDPVGGEDMYIKSIELKDGLITAATGGLVSSTSSGIVPKIVVSSTAINNQANDWILTSTSGKTPAWKKLPTSAFYKYVGTTELQATPKAQELTGIKNIIGENSKEIIHATDGYLEFGKGFSDVITWFNASLYKFKLGNTQAFIITTDGKVGIGDVGGAPKAKLHVAGGSVLADSYHARSGGFSKEGCSDAHILLAGGGHTAVSNFATVSGVSDSLKSYVTLSTNLTITGSKTFTASTNTFSGTGASILTVDRNSTNPAWIRFCKNGTLQGYIGITNDFQPVFLSGEAGSSNKTLLHAGNYTAYVNTTNFPGLNSVGDITGVTAGNGLTGGATSGTATLNVGAGTGITVNANDIAVKYGNTAGTACQGNDSRLSNARVNPNKLTIFGVEYDGSDEKTVTASTMIATLSEDTSNVTDNTEILTSYASNNGFADSNAPNILYKRDAICLYNYINTKLAGAHAGLDKVGTVTSVTVNGVNGLSGSGTVTTSGTITLSNAGVRSTTINGNYLRVNTNGTNADLTIPYATLSHSANTLNIGSLPSSTTNKEGTVWCKFATLTFNDSAYSPVSGYLFFSGRENPDFVGILHYHFIASDDKTKLGVASLKWLVNTSLSILVISVKTADNVYDLYINNYSTWVTPRIHNMMTVGSFVWNIGSWTTTKPTASHTSTLSGRVNYAISASNADTLDNIHASELLTSLSSTTTNAVSITVGGTTKNIAASTLKSSLSLGNVQNTAFYKRLTTVNGTVWNMAGTNSNAAFTIYAPTTAGTSGQVLTSTAGTPGWTNLSSLSVGYATNAKYLLTLQKDNTNFYSDTYEAYLKWESADTAAFKFNDGTYKFRADIANTANSVAWGNVSGKPSSYTPSAHDHTRILFIDDRNVVETPTDVAGKNGIEIHFKNKSKSSVPSTGDWTAVVMLDGYSDTSGGYPMELGFSMSDLSGSRPLYLRTPKSATEWGSWRTVLDSNTYTDFINTTNFAGLNKTGTVTSVTITQGTGITVSNSGTAITSSGTRTITLNAATSSAIGGVKLGYTASGANIPLQTSSNKGYVALTKAAVVAALGYTPPLSDTNTWRGITDSYSGTDSTISLSQKGGNALYNALVNGYATSAGNADTVDSYHIWVGSSSSLPSTKTNNTIYITI